MYLNQCLQKLLIVAVRLMVACNAYMHVEHSPSCAAAPQSA